MWALYKKNTTFSFNTWNEFWNYQSFAFEKESRNRSPVHMLAIHCQHTFHSSKPSISVSLRVYIFNNASDALWNPFEPSFQSATWCMMRFSTRKVFSAPNSWTYSSPRLFKQPVWWLICHTKRHFIWYTRPLWGSLSQPPPTPPCDATNACPPHNSPPGLP